MDEPKAYRSKVQAKPKATRQAKELRRALTPPECRLWLAIKAKQVDGLRFRKQVAIGSYIADFYCHAARLVVEVDGSQHNLQVEHDRDRDAWLHQQGICIVRFASIDIRDHLDAVLQRIRTESHRRITERVRNGHVLKTPSDPPEAGHLPRKPGGGE